jgi:hypothetical protein
MREPHFRRFQLYNYILIYIMGDDKEARATLGAARVFWQGWKKRRKPARSGHNAPGFRHDAPESGFREIYTAVRRGAGQ